MNIIFFGTPQFAADTLSYLLQNGVNVVAVITKPDKPKGRSGHPLPPPVKLIAEKHSIPYFQPALVSDPSFAPTLEAFHPDLFVVVAYGEIIKQHLLDMPKQGCINLHASLLPYYRGAAPIQRSIMNGEKTTGVTIMHMVKKMDAGDIISQVVVPIDIDHTFTEIEQQLQINGSEALLKAIHDISAGTAPRIPQNHEQATYAPKIELEDCKIDWSLPALTIHNLVRAVSPEPGAWCYVTVKGEKKRLKIFRTKLKTASTSQPGHVSSYGKSGLIVSCGTDALEIIDIQLEGKKAMSAQELMRGIPQDALSFILS